jgi:Ca-activated chloride channel homolog
MNKSNHPNYHKENPTMKKANLFIATALTLTFFIGFGCEQQPGSTSPTSNANATGGQRVAPAHPFANVKPVNIPLDDAAPGASVSTALNIYVVFDGSRSMNDRCDGKSKIEGAKDALRTFMGQVPNDVNMGLYVFDSRGDREVVPLGTGSRGQYFTAIENINDGGGTPLAEAIRHGTNSLVAQYKRQLGYGEYRLVVITDGQADSLESAALYAARYGWPIYTIGLCLKGDHELKRYSVTYTAANDYAALQQGLQDTLGELDNFDVDSFD